MCVCVCVCVCIITCNKVYICVFLSCHCHVCIIHVFCTNCFLNSPQLCALSPRSSLLCKHTGIKPPHVHVPSLLLPAQWFSPPAGKNVGFNPVGREMQLLQRRGRWWWRWWRRRWWCGGGGGGCFFCSTQLFQQLHFLGSGPPLPVIVPRGGSAWFRRKEEEDEEEEEGEERCGRRTESTWTRQSLGGISCHLLRHQLGLSAPLSMPAQN